MVIYKLVNKVNGKFYIGKSTKISERYKQHIVEAKLQKRPINCAIHKYGIENFEIQILDFADSIEELNSKEKQWISELDAIRMGYNISEGGDGGAINLNHPKKKEIYKKAKSTFVKNQKLGKHKKRKSLEQHWIEQYGKIEGKKKFKLHNAKVANDIKLRTLEKHKNIILESWKKYPNSVHKISIDTGLSHSTVQTMIKRLNLI